MARQITYGEESREALFRGIDSLANAVRVTLGPKGRNVILGKTFGAPTITKDGVTVAREITLKDPIEMKEKKARVEDAMHATKAAVEEGIVAGGGVALLRASMTLATLTVDGDEQIGVNIIRRASEEPMRWIATNAGAEGAVVVENVREMRDDAGFNAQTGQYENLVHAGIIDPTKVVRSALQNAASVASLLLTTEAVVSQLAS